MAKDIRLEYLLVTVKTIVDELEKLETYDIHDPKTQGRIMAIISAMKMHLGKNYEDFMRSRKN